MTTPEGLKVRVSRRVRLDGVSFDALTEAELADAVVAGSAEGRGAFVLTPNVDILRQLRRPALAAIATEADYVVADGMPLIWASRLQADPLPERVTGASLIWSLSRAAAAADRSVYLLGGDDGVAEAAAARLAVDIPGLTVAGWHFPPFGFDKRPDDMRAVVEALGAAQPDIVFVGLGFPKQEFVIRALREHFPAVVYVGCGASLTFAAGHITRAPGWMQRHGLEWVHRLVKEPRRLARRYLVEDAPYTVGLLLRSALRRGRGVPTEGPKP
ncbi:MAG: N-acetylglucosaminyldiphosphoundecaprenol N-acetyl-beta-D-mannosaminyltransferase [Frankiaceae bacterium]|nr:N-acetylglucosaminyldiphosphoundecaprenol N-acetyl-beta-D-mannosaminyltransferase [Frankiaceae bacterium]